MPDAGPETSPNDIAVIGLALRVPGARNADQFWQNLRDGVESIETRTPEELRSAGESSERMRRRNYVPRAAMLPGMADFDAEFFGIGPKEAAIMDPQHRQLIECAWEALEDAGRPPEKTSGPVGVFAGCGMGSYFYFNVLSHRELVDQTGLFLLRHTGNDKDFLATRVSFLLDLHGPSINIQTACSTSLVAVHYACQSLLNGECEMALAGGATIEQPQGQGYLYQEGEILSPDGHCRAFDHRAAGTVFGSGVGVVVLKRLAAAIADGDPIRAVIKASAVNNDGAGKASYLAPSVTGQAEAIVEAHGLAGIEADTVQYVECHGTGTYLGDPIEIAALTDAFRRSTERTGYCRIGSVKSNIGHLDTAAGVVSLIKTVLALEHREIPATLGFERCNPAIDLAASPFVVNDRLTPWPAGPAPRRAGVNSLGVGGTNAHVIVEEAPPRAAPRSTSASGPQILMISARNRKALDEAGRRLAAKLEAEPDLRLADVAFSLAETRRRLDMRRVVAVADRADAIAVLADPESKRAATHVAIEGQPQAVMLFPGGGAQYPGMARVLYSREREFAAVVDQGLSHLPPDVADDIRELWLGSQMPAAEAAKRLLQPSLQLPAILILEVALARLWQRWGLQPTALIGHSMGEYAAASVAGVMSFERAVRLVHLRGQLFDEIADGGMLSVELTPERLRELLPSDLDLAVHNAPELCVVAGPNAALEAFALTLDAHDVGSSRVPIDIAAHSRMLEPILARFEAFLRETPLAPPRIPIVSNVTGTWLTASEATDPRYWVGHLRSTVRFADGLAKLAADPTRVYIEVGPGRVLSSLAKAQGSIAANAIVNSLPHADEACDDHLHYLSAVGRAWALGLDLPVDRLWSGHAPQRVRLPTYAFQHKRYFIDRIADEPRQTPETGPVRRSDMAQWGWTPSWRQADAEPAVHSGPQSFLVLLDDAGVGADLVTRLRAAGHKAIAVALGDSFAATADGGYVLCPEHGLEGYDALVQHLAENGGLPRNIVNLWLLTADERFRPGSSFFHRNQERGFYSLFFLAQALGEAAAAGDLQITIVANGMQKVRDEPLPYPEKATVLGPAQVLDREMPGVHTRVIDLPADVVSAHSGAGGVLRQLGGAVRGALGLARPAAVAETIWDDLHATRASEIVAYRAGRRWVRTWRETPLAEPSAGAQMFRNRGVYMITGGLGDIAHVCAVDLARRFEARLVLVGRTRLPDRGDWDQHVAKCGTTGRIGRAIEAIRDIETAGGEVLYIEGDVTNPDAMRRALSETKARFGAINGVLHAAGTVKDDLIQIKSAADVEDVLAPKVLGTLVLDEVLAGEPLDLMVLFSSTSTEIAPAGQVDYVAANAFLNAFADAHAGRASPRTIALHWGVWSGVGLAARAIRQAESGEDGQGETVEPARQPLLERRVRDDNGSERLELNGATSTQWLLDEHRLRSGEAIWPGTGFIELVAEAAREAGIAGPLQIENMAFIRPLYVADGRERAMRITVTHSGARLSLAIESAIDRPEGRGWLRHAEASALPWREAEPGPLDVAAEIAACRERSRSGGGPALRTAQEEHLRFGPRWQVLREVHIGKASAIARLKLADSFLGDIESGLILHPALLDIATGFAMELIDGYDPAAGLWVPMTYGRIRIHRPMPAEIWSRAALSRTSQPGSGYACFDVSIVDNDGRALVEVEGFTMKLLEGDTNFSQMLDDNAVAPVERRAAARSQAELSPALARLAAQVEQGILPAEGGEALMRAVGSGLSQVVVSSMDLAELQKAATAQAAPRRTATLERPDIASTFKAPGTPVERTLAGFWNELLGIERIGIDDSFFDLGGHSLIAVRLFRMIKRTYEVDLPISVLFEAPTIASCARLIEQAGIKTGANEAATSAPATAAATQPRYTHLVQMHRGKGAAATPLFICAGMFGNLLNLRHLAVQAGQDRPVYGLQARGIYGDQAPHETFEEMAESCLEEVRSVQPNGPYLLCGFSGGGLVAHEMASQLQAAGETVALLVLLDTPFPEVAQLSVADRLTMKLQDARREKGAMLGQWVRRRVAWELRRLRQLRAAPEPAGTEQFHNEAVEAAFRRALARYHVKPYAGRTLLLRPRLRVQYHLRDGRMLNSERSILRPDNGWSNQIGNLVVVEVPGDHDSMVLEPNVRVLAQNLRDALRSAEQTLRPLPATAECAVVAAE